MDSLTAHYLALELDARWRGQRVRRSRMDRQRGTVSLSVAHDDVGVCFDLGDPHVQVYECPAPGESGPMGGWLVAGVGAPEDERRIVIRLERPGKFRGSVTRRATLELSVVPTARGAELRVNGDAAATDRARVIARLGASLPAPHPPRAILGADELVRIAAEGDERALAAGRWMSPWLAQCLLQQPAHLRASYERICALPPAVPWRYGDVIVPFPFCAGGEAAASLVAPRPVPPTGAGDRRTRRPADRWSRATETPPFRSAGALAHRGAARGRIPADRTAGQRALDRMRRELERAHEAPRVRAVADVLMAIGTGPAPSEVTLADGSRCPTQAKPGESALVCAERLFRRARSMERALEQLPRRIELAAGTATRAAGAADERVADASAGDAPARGTTAEGARAGRGGARPSTARTYREYRTTTGHAVWVGRGAASNDDLTFRAAAPNDVWLHARDAAGAHVVLRWHEAGAPPERALHEAALLAAWHSKGRHATVVPVDWTRRKYVRKPRGAAPGSVTLSQANTLFVRPSARVERALRVER